MLDQDTIHVPSARAANGYLRALVMACPRSDNSKVLTVYVSAPVPWSFQGTCRYHGHLSSDEVVTLAIYAPTYTCTSSLKLYKYPGDQQRTIMDDDHVEAHPPSKPVNLPLRSTTKKQDRNVEIDLICDIPMIS
jgi:hypothetical protein